MKYKQSKNSRLLTLEKELKYVINEVSLIKQYLDDISSLKHSNKK